MIPKSIQDLLPLVERPSRYLGSEINTIRKDLSQTALTFALAFPDLYEIGTSHFGVQILYHVLNGHPNIAAERVFAPAEDVEALLRSTQTPLTSLETHTPLNNFDIIGFSLLYELNYTNILTILDLAGIPFFARDRDPAFPLVVGGGPCACNPEPLADFFDAFVIGDGEEAVLEMAEAWLAQKKAGAVDRAAVLDAWSSITGVYIPARFPVRYSPSGFQALDQPFQEADQKPATVKRAVLADLNGAAFPATPILPFGRPVHDRLRLEVSRGCTRGCRFCQAGMIYRPVRERSEATLMNMSRASLDSTGYEDISLLSLSTGDYSCIASLMAGLMDANASNHTAVSLPSLRAGTLTPELMAHIKRVRKTGFTIAPEAGSQRLRNVINKNISREEILVTVKNAFGLGWQVIKLYFMIGLPTETDQDLEGIVELVEDLRKIKGHKGRPGKINVSVTTFIPKPHTPFQWHSQISLEESREKINWLRARLKKPGVQFKWQNPDVSFLEGLWARGDRRLSKLLITAYQKGCRFDGWSDHFNFRVWETAFSEAGMDVPFYVNRKRDLDEPLPWDHIDMRVHKSFLVQEWQAAHDERVVLDCRWNPCNDCGVCDFETIQPRLHERCENRSVTHTAVVENEPGFYKVFELAYSKTGSAKYFAHLELANIMIRALRRARIPVKYSEGYHPMPKISFDDPLPVGIESLKERLFITVPGHLDGKDILSRLAPELPEGIALKTCTLASKKRKPDKDTEENYSVELQEGVFESGHLERFSNCREYLYVRQNRKGRQKSFDLKKAVPHIVLKSVKKIEVRIRKENGVTLRPHEILSQIFGLSRDELKTATVIKGLGEHV
ncbi:MAG: TIGR03960 family B12-binding radical SAM protein [Thermodesulfobacteriota bacterium]